MIIRADSIAISQVAHAELTERLARQLDFQRWGIPQPPELWFQALSRHDDGWLMWDRNPEINPETGHWYNFLDLPVSAHLDIWHRSVDLAEGLHPATAWWISRHVMKLFEMHEWSSETREQREKAEVFKSNQLLKQQQTQSVIGQFPGYQLLDYLLAECDWLSLALCMGVEQTTILPAYSGKTEGLSLYNNSDKVHIFPWPFRKKELNPTIEAFDTTDKSDTRLKTLQWHIRPENQ